MTFFIGLALQAFGLVRAAISWVFANPRVIPYLVIALLAGATWLEHARLQSSQRETASIKTELRTAVAANQSDAATIAALQRGLASLKTQLGQAQSDGVAAAAKASQASRVLTQRLSAAQSALSQLQGNPSYEAFLGTDLNTLYPELARSLRDLDAAAQD